MSTLPPDPEPEWRGAIPLAAGIAALVVLVAGIGFWSANTQISGALATSGTLRHMGEIHVVQHPVGGVIRKVLVKNGDVVATGDPLIELEAQPLKADLGIVQQRLDELSARAARLTAERDGQDDIKFANALQKKAETDSHTRRLMDAERQLFQTRRAAQAQEQRLLDQRNAQIDVQIDAFGDQIAALDQEVDRPKGRIAELTAEIARLREKQATNHIGALDRETQRLASTMMELHILDSRNVNLLAQKRALERAVADVDLRAPASGIVRGLGALAEHATLRADTPVMSIIPQEQSLIIAAWVDAADIGKVAVEQAVVLNMPAAEARDMAGTVTRVAPTAQQDPATGALAHLVEIRPEIPEGMSLPRGATFEVLIQTEGGSPLAYLVEPITAFFADP